MHQGGGQPPRQPEMNFDQMLGGVRDVVGRISQRLGGGGVGLAVALVIALIVIIWAATGIYTINPGEQAALRLFGAAQTTPVIDTGLHWWWPSPVGSRDVLRTDLTRVMELGFRSGEGVADTPVPVEAQMISGDLNIIDVRMVVQYDIKNLNNYLFRVDDPGDSDGANRNIPPGRPDGRTLKDATEAALRLVVGQRSIVDVLGENRSALNEPIRQKLQEILDSYQAGLNVKSVELKEVQAPEDVRAAFNDVLQARQDKVTATNQAQAYENQVIPEARGRAEQIIQPAEAFRQGRIQRARGEADQFISILQQYSDRSVRLTNTLQDTDGSDSDGDPTTGIGIEDVAVMGGEDMFVSSLSVQGAPDCGFTAREVESTAVAQVCTFSVQVDGSDSSPDSGAEISVAYLGNEDLTVPQFATSGFLNLRLRNFALDIDNADGDNDLTTGVTVADLTVVDGPDGGAAPGVDLSVSGFNSLTNILTLQVQDGEVLEPGASFTVQYLNHEELAIPYTSQVTQERLYLEAMEEILPSVNKILVPEGTEPVLLIGGQDGVVPVPVGPSPSP